MSVNKATSSRRSGSEPRLFGPPPGPGMMGATARAKDVRGTIFRLWSYLRRQKKILIFASFIVIITSGLNLLGPFLMGRAIDKYILPHDLPGLRRICLLMAFVHSLNSALVWLQGYVMASASQRTVRDLRNDLFTKLQSLPLRFFDQRSHGDLMSRLTNDVENVSQVLTDSVTQIVSGVISMFGVAGMMFWLNAELAAISIASVTFLTLVLNRWVVQHTREGFRQQQATLGDLNGLIEETVSGQRVVIAYGKQEATLSQFDDANRKYREAATHAQIYSGFVGPFMNCNNNFALAIVAGIGGALAVRGAATVGTIASFINYTRQFGRPLNDIANLYNNIQSAIAGAERVFEVIDETPEIDGDSSIDLDAIEGDVVFDAVDFSYTPGTPVLKGVSFHAEPGQVIALIGPTGAGKTTIVNLLTRFYEIDNGSIRVDGKDIREIRKDDLRRNLGIVLQDNFLFAGTVKENIRYGKLDATDEEIVAAAKTANADQFIHRLPEGYDTELSERGGNLSQGQRQLLSIARAILANPSILILDEATSSVDTRTERHIQEAMLRLMTGRTSFVIAHRLNTIRNADQILSIVDGEIIERGTHEELMDREGFYYRLCSGHFETSDDLVSEKALEIESSV